MKPLWSFSLGDGIIEDVDICLFLFVYPAAEYFRMVAIQWLLVISDDTFERTSFLRRSVDAVSSMSVHSIKRS